ncbi:MAG: CvpA family protein [bacterium]
MTELLGFNSADIIALIIILISMGAGFKHGLSAQMALLLMALSAWTALVNGLDPCQHWLAARYAMPADYARIISMIILIAVPILVITLLYTFLRYVLKITFTTWVDRIGGAIAGGLTAAGIITLVFLLIECLPPERRPAMIGPQSWIMREVVGTQTQLVQSIMNRVERGENVIEKARENSAGRREKWEE